MCTVFEHSLYFRTFSTELQGPLNLTFSEIIFSFYIFYFIFIIWKLQVLLDKVLPESVTEG